MLKKIKKTLSILCCLLLAGTFFCPTEVLASSFGLSEIDHDTKIVMSYVTVTDESIFMFDKEGAIANNETNEIIEIGEKLQEFSIAYANTENSTTRLYKASVPTLPIYGNYCGPKYGSDDPIDYLDQLCQKHDDCYSKNGYYSCACDKTLVKNINKKYDKMEGSQKTAAAAVKLYFQWCIDHPTKEGGIGHCKE